ncbi:MAG: SpoIIE family protein phosphatase [Spirochaetales bacterium]|nr:SpoIIE family protein phosphatase [Spirochaetales bacterium]
MEEIKILSPAAAIPRDSQPSAVLRTVRSEKVYGASLLRVASCFRFVNSSTLVAEVARVFQQETELDVVGVCFENGQVLGLVTRSHLFGLLGRPFGQEVLGKKKIEEFSEKAQTFDQHANLFQVAEQIQPLIQRTNVHYFLLSTLEGHFAGIFSSKDLLLYLSQITQEDIQLAGILQERLVKGRESWDWETVNIQALSQSAKGLGGDFYHVVAIPDGRIFFTLGDVSGKGAAASILTSLLWGVLEFYDYRKGLKTLIHQLNTALIRTFHLEKYLTGIFGIYDPRRREVVYSDMGHGHALIVRNGKPRALRFPNMNLPLGIDQGLSPQIYRFHVQSDDLLCFYTDGLTEQVNERGEEWGEASLLSLLKKTDPAEVPDRVVERLNAHQGAVPRLDDVTWLQLNFLPVS